MESGEVIVKNSIILGTDVPCVRFQDKINRRRMEWGEADVSIKAIARMPFGGFATSRLKFIKNKDRPTTCVVEACADRQACA